MSAPVVGIGEAAYRAASIVAQRFAVITTLGRSIADIEDAVDAAPASPDVAPVCSRSRFRVAHQGAAIPPRPRAIVRVGIQATAELGAGALVLACGGMSDVTDAVADATGCP